MTFDQKATGWLKYRKAECMKGRPLKEIKRFYEWEQDMSDPIKLENAKFISEIPKGAGELVGTCTYKGHLIVACQYGIFRLVNDVLIQIKFKE